MDKYIPWCHFLAHSNPNIHCTFCYPEGLRRLLCEIAVEPVDDSECLLDRVFQEDAHLWKGMENYDIFVHICKLVLTLPM